MIVISGSHGLVGSSLVPRLTARGHDVRLLVRHAPRSPNERRWRPEAGEIDATSLDGAGVVINLAGENIAQRWTAVAKRRIRDSRVDGTALLAATIAGRLPKPRALINASAVGIYGDRGDEELDEASASGGGFLASVCREWEAATAPAAAAGVRVAMLRTGVVLSKAGGALPKLALPFRFGVGGRVGSGRQWTSWITLDDMVRGLLHIIDDDALAGPINLTAPNPVRNEELARALGHALHRPARVPVPAFAIRLALGEMGVESLLASQRARPTKLAARGFAFEHATIAAALAALYGERADHP